MIGPSASFSAPLTKLFWAEMLRPWKLVTWAIGMSWLAHGALTLHIPDWDIGISIVMGMLTYVLAPWVISMLIEAVRQPERALLLLSIACLVTWLVMDGSYVMYHTIQGNQMFRLANFPASLCLFLLAGILWSYKGSLKQLLQELRAAFDRT